LGQLAPLVTATSLTPVIYGQQTVSILLKVGEVFSGVFDTSVPAYPLAGMLFALMFISLRRREFSALLADTNRDWGIMAVGVSIATIPFFAVLAIGSLFNDSYPFAGIALVCSWVGLVVALRPSLFRFLSPYLLVYLVAVGFVGLLTEALGDPLAIAVAAISNAITSLLRLPVQWSSVYISFMAAGNAPVSLYVSQECSGIASMSIFLMVIALIHLDMKPSLRASLLFAAGGSILFILLNSLRVVGLIVGGITGGVDLMWNLHGWLGYALYILGYSVIILFYTRIKKADFPVAGQPFGRSP